MPLGWLLTVLAMPLLMVPVVAAAFEFGNRLLNCAVIPAVAVFALLRFIYLLWGVEWVRADAPDAAG